MLTFLLILLVVWFALAVLLAAGSLAIQGYIYSEPVGDIFWRAPAAAGAVTAFIGFWCFANYRAADPKAQQLPYETILTSAATEDMTEPVREFWAEKAGTRVHYLIFKDPTTVPVSYRYQDDNKKPFRHDGVEAIILKEGDVKAPTEVVFRADPKTNRYVEEGGKRYMNADNFGRIFTPRPSRSAFMLVLNALHLVVWFLAVWLLLRFQWTHALGIAAACWLAMTLLIMPQILSRLPRRTEAPAATANVSGRISRTGPDFLIRA